MSVTWKLRLALWIQGVVGAFIGGGSGAVAAGITVPALDKSGDFQFLSPVWFKLIAAMFVMHGILGAAMWMKQHQLEIIPPTDEESPKP